MPGRGAALSFRQPDGARALILLTEIAALSIFAFAGALFAVMVAAKEAGYLLGRRRREAQASGEIDGVGFVVSGMLGLLAFALGLTLSMAQSRFEDRRRIALDEANAIGTAWLRAEAIGHPRGPAIARLLEDYTRLRIEFVIAPPKPPDVVEAINARTSAMQSLIWGHAAALVRERTDPVAAALQAALNETFDLAGSQRWAFRARLPEEVVVLLLGMSVLTTAGLGYQLGLRRRRFPVVSTLLLLMWAGSITAIGDLSAPRIGSIRVDVSPYEWTLQGFRGGVTIPPSP